MTGEDDMADTEMPRLEIPHDRPKDQAEKEGLSVKTLRRAKEQIGVLSQRSGAGWEWNLDTRSDAQQGAQGGHFPMAEKWPS